MYCPDFPEGQRLDGGTDDLQEGLPGGLDAAVGGFAGCRTWGIADTNASIASSASGEVVSVISDTSRSTSVGVGLSSSELLFLPPLVRR